MKNLWEKLVNYSESDYYPFHMPGHKRLPKNEEGALACYKRFPKHEENVLTCYKRLPKNEEGALTCYKSQQDIEDIYSYDITEIEGFDNLHDAKDLLLALQQKAAHIYHAAQSFFLVNGSTGGILSAISTVAQDGKKLLMARNCHKSVYNGVALNRLQAEFLWPEIIEDFEIQGEITAEQVKKHLAGRQDICGVLITSPTYDGIVSDIQEIAKAVHDCRIPLIVDEAHGAHFVLSERAPENAVECGADIVINSIHKTLPALTQTALLHVQGELIDREKLQRYLSMYQSSSPSYLLMASIDKCIDFIAEQGRERYERLLALRKFIDESAAKLSHIRILPAGERRDSGKLVISVKGTEMTGWKLYQILLKKYHLQMEMAASSYVLGILTVMDTEEGVARLVDALDEIDKKLAENNKESTAVKKKELPKDSKESIVIKKKEQLDDIYSIISAASGLSIYEAIQKERIWLLPKEAVGKISGEFVSFYPPGIPMIVPGEVINEELACKIEKTKENIEALTGISKEGKLCVLKE